MIIDLHNGVKGIMFEWENAGEVIDFVQDNYKGNVMDIIQYNPKLNVYTFGKSQHVLLDGMYLVYSPKEGRITLTGNPNWIDRYNV